MTVQELPGKPRLDPPGGDFWVFGYGSLIWRPGFPHKEARPAMLHGFHRRFCVYSHRYRGTPDCPGLVLGLTRGGSCRGIAYKVPEAEGEGVMDYLYEREMVLGVYDPTWLKLRLDTGDAVLVADMSRAQDVKKAVAALKAKEAPQATAFPKDHRPWGWFESLVVGPRFQVKRILVHPGASLDVPDSTRQRLEREKQLRVKERGGRRKVARSARDALAGRGRRPPSPTTDRYQ